MSKRLDSLQGYLDTLGNLLRFMHEQVEPLSRLIKKSMLWMWNKEQNVNKSQSTKPNLF